MDNTLTKLRLYRVNFNGDGDGNGIALFDLIGTFFIAYLLNKYLDVNNKTLYYLSVLPIAVLAHLLVGKSTFLNQHLFSKEFNTYKLLFIVIFLAIYKNI